MQKLYIHIGKGKTATTYLQESLFKQHESLNYIAKWGGHYPQWLIDWHYLDDFCFEKRVDFIRDALVENMVEDKINVISSEAFYELGGGWFKQMQRIKVIAPYAKIILTFRDPIASIMSFIKYSILKNDYFFFSFDDIVDYECRPHVFYKRKPIYLPDYFFSDVYDTYVDAFGVKNVLALKYEDFSSNKAQYFRELSTFLTVNIDMDSLNNDVLNSSATGDFHHCQLVNLMQRLKHGSSIVLQSENTQVNQTDIEALMKANGTTTKIVQCLQDKCLGYY